MRCDCPLELRATDDWMGLGAGVRLLVGEEMGGDLPARRHCGGTTGACVNSRLPAKRRPLDIHR